MTVGAGVECVKQQLFWTCSKSLRKWSIYRKKFINIEIFKLKIQPLDLKLIKYFLNKVYSNFLNLNNEILFSETEILFNLEMTAFFLMVFCLS